MRLYKKAVTITNNCQKYVQKPTWRVQMFAESQTFVIAQILLSLLLEMFIIPTVFVVHVAGTNILAAICETFVLIAKNILATNERIFSHFSLATCQYDCTMKTYFWAIFCIWEKQFVFLTTFLFPKCI